MLRKAAVLLLILATCSACRLLPAPEQKPLADNPPRSATEAGNQPADRLNSISRAVNQFDGKAGVYAKNLKTGNTIGVNEHQLFPAASTHKLVVALAIYKYIYPEASTDKKREYDQHIKDMMVVSDNPAFYDLLQEIEKTNPNALTQVLTDLKLTKTRIHSREAFNKYGYHSVTTPYEMAVVFETIYKEQYLGKEMSAILKEELAKTIFRDEIPRFMQKNKVMHKVGSLPGMLCDVGIVDDGRDQILISVYTTTRQSETCASNFIADTSAELYNSLRIRKPG